MASPLKNAKQSVNLAAPRVPGSRIRRDPPPAVKEVTVVDLEDRDRRDVIVGVLVFALALFVILIGFSSFTGWSPADYEIHLDDKDM